MGYTVKVMAEKVGLKPHVLRYYEKEGLLPHVNRAKSGIRHYTDEDLEWLGLICCLKNTGMSIKQIRDFVNLSLQGPEALKERCEMLVAHKRDVEAHILEMQKQLETVTHKINFFQKKYDEYLMKETADCHNQSTEQAG